MTSAKDLLIECLLREYGKKIGQMKRGKGKSWERGLYLLLRDCQNDLPELNENFRKVFEHTSVTNSGTTDRSIFNMLSASTVFEEAFYVVVKKELK
ncbi:hypothetical protein N9137_02220 [Pseudomonadales bacterium]|nr:hypothetical protein [Pseudomonadales bacterium]